MQWLSAPVNFLIVNFLSHYSTSVLWTGDRAPVRQHIKQNPPFLVQRVVGGIFMCQLQDGFPYVQLFYGRNLSNVQQYIGCLSKLVLVYESKLLAHRLSPKATSGKHFSALTLQKPTIAKSLTSISLYISVHLFLHP